MGQAEAVRAHDGGAARLTIDSDSATLPDTSDRFEVHNRARLHDLRHAAATTMMERGVHPAVVSKSLGHASEAFTMSVYGHVRDEWLDQAADALGAAYGENL